MVELKRRGQKVATMLTESSATIKKKFMASAELSIVLKSDKYVDFKRGDYVEVDGETFHLFELPSVSMNAKAQYEWSCVFHSEDRLFEDTMFLFLDTNGSNRIYQSSTDYDLTATIDEFLSLLCKNLNRVSSGWQYTVIAGADRTKLVNLSFSGETVKSALKKVTDAFELEYMIDGKRIKVGKKVERKTGLVFSYPRNLLSPISVELEGNENTATKLYVFGGERNIPKGYQDGKSDRLLMPNGAQFLKRNSDHVIEKVKTFDDIYPRRNSTINKVRNNEAGFFFVTDDSIDFNLISSMTELTPKISFANGLLVGYEFEIASYNSESKEIEIKQQMDGNIAVPNSTICPRVGDSYVFLDIKMPQKYIDNAEYELQSKAKEYFDSECREEIKIQIKPSDIWLQRHGIKLDAGDTITVRCEEMGIDKEIRIESVTSYPLSLKTQDIELANIKKKSKLDNISDAITANSDNSSRNSTSQTNTSSDTSLTTNDLNNRTSWNED